MLVDGLYIFKYSQMVMLPISIITVGFMIRIRIVKICPDRFVSPPPVWLPLPTQTFEPSLIILLEEKWTQLKVFELPPGLCLYLQRESIRVVVVMITHP